MKIAICGASRTDGARTRYAYVLSDKGKKMGLMVFTLMRCGDKHLKDGVAAIDVNDRKIGKPLEVALVHRGDAVTTA